MKTYVLTVSTKFPQTHPKRGEETNFIEKLEIALDLGNWKEMPFAPYKGKFHTIRANYDLWKKRIEEIQVGKAILSIRYWSGKPYNSKQIEICQLNKDSGIGIQKAEFRGAHIQKGIFHVIVSRDNDYYMVVNENDLATNDGLSIEDFKAWFKGYDLSKPLVIIHFTKFRYPF